MNIELNHARNSIIKQKMEIEMTSKYLKEFEKLNTTTDKTKNLASAEALSRWETSAGEVIFPGDYIGLMEAFGLISKFDY